MTSLFGATQQPGRWRDGLGKPGGRARHGPRPLTWALSTCPLTISRKTLGPAAAIAGVAGNRPRLRARQLRGALVALETDGVACGTRFFEAGPSVQARVRGRRCAGAASGFSLREFWEPPEARAGVWARVRNEPDTPQAVSLELGPSAPP